VSRILMPLAAGYKMGAVLRRAAYRRGWLSTRSLGHPVVSVGNLTVGGTGKTPLVAYLADLLLKRGWKPSILTRGYGRRNESELIAVEPARERSPNPREVGDEPALLARKLPQVPIVVGADRFLAGFLAESRFNADVHILDDGFQHMALARDVDIVVVDVTQKFSDAALLPAGRLREPVSALQRAHIIILSRVELGDAAKVKEQVRGVNPRAMIFSIATRLREILTLADGSLHDVEEWRGKPALAFCAIGNPRAFFADLRRWGFTVVEEAAFRDHHVYTCAELDRLTARARQAGATALLTTEKDGMNLPPEWKSEFPVRACVVETEFHKAGVFEEALIQYLPKERISA
jgi:tetraacyldisaccharide 4'-kinase